jgi:hypothetical protein
MAFGSVDIIPKSRVYLINIQIGACSTLHSLLVVVTVVDNNRSYLLSTTSVPGMGLGGYCYLYF